MSQPQNRIASGMSFAQLGLLSGRSYQKYILPHDSVSVCPHATAASARQFHGPAREGLGGEKAARGDASLPVPPAPHLPRQSNTPTQVRTGSAPGEGERKCEGVFPQKSGKSRSYFRGSHSLGPALATEPGLTGDPYPAPAPCRTQGVRGAADTPPGTYTALYALAPCRTQGVRRAADTPPGTHRTAHTTRRYRIFTLIELLVRTTC